MIVQLELYYFPVCSFSLNLHYGISSTYQHPFSFHFKECEQGFELPGRRLGGYSRQPPLSSLRQSALAAAENRAKHGSLLPSGPRRIGGDSNIRAVLSPIQAAAMAAERRMHDDLWCASKSSESDGVPETIEPPIEVKEKSTETSVAPTSSQTNSQESKDAAPMWQCGVCTLSNQVNLCFP